MRLHIFDGAAPVNMHLRRLPKAREREFEARPVALRVEAKMAGSASIHPFDLVMLVEDDEAVGKGLHGAPETLQGIGQEALLLSALPGAAVQAGKDSIP